MSVRPISRMTTLDGLPGAKREETKQKRLAQMLEELRQGEMYMEMEYRPARLKERRSQTAGVNE